MSFKRPNRGLSWGPPLRPMPLNPMNCPQEVYEKIGKLRAEVKTNVGAKKRELFTPIRKDYPSLKITVRYSGGYFVDIHPRQPESDTQVISSAGKNKVIIASSVDKWKIQMAESYLDQSLYTGFTMLGRPAHSVLGDPMLSSVVADCYSALVLTERFYDSEAERVAQENGWKMQFRVPPGWWVKK